MADGEKKPSFFEGLKGVLFEEDRSTPKKAGSSSLLMPSNMRAPVGVPLQQATARSVGFSTLPLQYGPTEADPEALVRLEAVLARSSPKDYVQYSTVYEKLRTVIPDERMRVNAALTTSGLTAAQLNTAIDTCLTSLTTAKSVFDTQFDQQKIQLDSGEALQPIEAEITARRDQVVALQSQLKELETKHATVLVQVKESQQRIQAVRLGFEAALAQVIGRLNAQRQI